MINSIAEEFMELIKRNFPNVQFRDVTTRPNPRTNAYVPNSRNNKRWMQIDQRPESFHVAMDHLKGDITVADLKSTGIRLGHDGIHTGISLTPGDDAVELSVFPIEPVTIEDQTFLDFLEKHYNSYLRRIGQKR